MTGPTAPVCPSCAGRRMPDHPSGFTWQHGVQCPTLAEEDGRKVADLELLARQGWPATRPATDAERRLLAACGHVLAPAAATTVRPVTASIVHRAWPGFEPDLPPSPSAPLTSKETP